MTNHPITPPPELVKQWVSLACEYEGDETWIDLATEAANWGADQELEACCNLLRQQGFDFIDDLRATRRPKPSLNELALQMLGTIERDAHYLPEVTDTIRRALEALDD